MTLLPDATTSFAHDLTRHGHRTAVVDAPSGRELTYLDLQAEVNEAAARLGDGQPRLVLIEATRSVGTVVAYLAALQLAHPVLLVPSGRPSALARLADRFDPDVVVTGREGHVDERRSGSAHELHPDLALLLSTSGSTGACKLVRLSRANLQANADAIAAALGIRPDDRAITSLPLAYCYGLSVLHSHLARGAAVVLSEASIVDDAFWQAVREHGVTTLAGVPHTFELLDRIGFDRFDLPSLRTVTQAGGRLDPSAVRRFAELGRRRGWDLHVMYGQTEATARMACLPPDLAATHSASIGRPIPGGSFALAPADGDGVGEGELVYRGPNVMLGYAHGPADLAEGRTVHELHTGDVARVDGDGLYEVVGRRSRFVKPFGLRIDLDGLERALREAGVESMVAGDDRGVVVATTSGDGCEVHGLVLEATGLVPVAVHVEHVDGLPRLANGKADHPAVLALRTASASSKVRAVFQDVLGVARVGDDDTFASVGGDSLSYVELAVRLEELLGHLPAAWPTMSVAALERLASDPPRRTERWMRVVETTVVLRAAAVALIVATHAGLTDLRGGAHLLLAIAGWNFARFQLPAAPRRLGRSVGRILVPTLVWLTVLLVVTDDYAPHNLLLLHSQIGPEPWSPQWRYWFVEALVPILLVLGGSLCVPWIRSVERRLPFGLAVGLASSLLAVSLTAGDDRVIHRPQTIAWVFALGWAAQRAESVVQRVAVSILSVIGAHLFFVDPEREGVLIAGMLLVLWVRTVPVVAPLHRLTGTLAAASLWIYLVHWQVYPTVVEQATPAVATVVSLAAGVGAHGVWSAAGRRKVSLGRPRPAMPRCEPSRDELQDRAPGA